MKREYISDTIGNISTRHIQEAENYEPSQKKNCFFKRPFGRAMVAAVLALCLIVGGIGVFSPFDGMVVTAYAHGTDEEITAAGAVINTGTISNTGEMTGHPLMFYLSGKDIVTVRFSCKNQQINFMDWTEKRDEYGNAQNFTVTYGEDSSEYYYLTVDWIPDSIIRELTDNPESTIATLPDEFREDIIVMEITFANGKTATKAITVSLLDDGTFFAAFNDYEIKETDNFVKQIDSIAIPREILYSEGFDKSSGYNTSEEQIVTANSHDFFGDISKIVIVDGSTGNERTIDSAVEIKQVLDVLENLNVRSQEKSRLQGYQYAIKLYDRDTVQRSILVRDTSVEVDGTLYYVETTENLIKTISMSSNEFATQSGAEDVAKIYYSDTVFEVVSMELKSQTENEITFSVCTSKGILDERQHLL